MQARSRFSLAAGLLLVFVFLVASAGPRGRVLAADPTPEPPHKLFLPFTSRTDTFTVQGSVADAQGQPLAGVVVSDGAGRRAVTEADGSYALSGLPQGAYALAAEHPSYVFSPGLLQGTLPNTELNNFTAYQACVEALVNGGFETAAGWELPATQLTAAYSSAVVHSGQRALRTGVYATANLYSYSSGRQAVTIPAGTASALLRVWLYPFTTETPINAASALPEQPAAGLHVTDAESAILGSDVQYVLVLDAVDNVLDTLLWIRSNSQQWTYYEFNLTKYAGLPIQIQVGTFNDGIGGATAMFADDLALQICD
ncbi:MAG TPA: carboxypeptidase-like regulatory domain-containing protein, partial [Anaerolineales bacterium]|nr:carboxypeptidase-like regulatory domain-containing protein [Anaerolineales bacterium]